MRNRTLALAALLGIALAAPASAHQLTIPQARAAMSRAWGPRASIGHHCARLSARSVRCPYSEPLADVGITAEGGGTWHGWLLASRRQGRVRVWQTGVVE